MGFEGAEAENSGSRRAREGRRGLVGDGGPEKSRQESGQGSSGFHAPHPKGGRTAAFGWMNRSPVTPPGVTDALRLRAAVESLIPRRSAPTKSRDRWRVIGCRDGTE